MLAMMAESAKMRTASRKTGALETARSGAVGAQMHDEPSQRGQLQMLVRDLLEENEGLRVENQNLRLQTSQLERRAESAERGLANATRWAGALF
jgi:hypothetical protein